MRNTVPRVPSVIHWLLRTLPVLAALGITCSSLKAQVLISATPIETRDTVWLHANGIEGATTAVTVLKLTYWTPNLNGVPSVASAAFIDPATSCPTPLVVFIHGTAILKIGVPSHWDDSTGVGSIGFTYGGHGMACIMPDLLGLGDSPGHHPYLHAASEASASMDAVRAAREYRQQQGNPLNEQLFLTGASAGSHACLATAQAMQTVFPDEFHITAVAGVNGPYAIYNTVIGQITETTPDASAGNLPYILLSYNLAYPDLFSSVSNFLVAPYNVVLPPLYNGLNNWNMILPFIAAVPSIMIPQALQTDLLTNPNSALGLVLQENDVYNWTPDFPMRMYYCGGDERVPPANSVTALNAFLNNGATDVTAPEPSATAGHAQCGMLSRPLVFNWFLSLKEECSASVGIKEPLDRDPGFSLFPNPVVSGNVSLDLTSLHAGGKVVRVSVLEATGRTINSQDRLVHGDGRVEVDVGQLAVGTYFVQVAIGDSIYREKLAVMQ